MEIPVYLFTGFLEGGKTKFIQETLEDPRFDSGEDTLLLLCEEGLTDYDPHRFAGDNVYKVVVEDEDELTPENLSRILTEAGCQRIIIEYNGMWMLDSLFSNLPEGWLVFQEFLFVDSGTFLTYNANMRNLVVDKLKSCDTVIFNRVTDAMDREEFHKIVRAVNRRTDIIYEDIQGNAAYDEMEDPLPFDREAPVIEIQEDQYAIWYRDVSEEMDAYDGKTVSVSGYAVRSPELGDESFIFGRPVMTCCVEDITFAGMVCNWAGAAPLQDRDWVSITARIAIEEHKAYDKPGPVLYVESLAKTTEPEDDVATFY